MSRNLCPPVHVPHSMHHASTHLPSSNARHSAVTVTHAITTTVSISSINSAAAHILLKRLGQADIVACHTRMMNGENVAGVQARPCMSAQHTPPVGWAAVAATAAPRRCPPAACLAAPHHCQHQLGWHVMPALWPHAVPDT